MSMHAININNMWIYVSASSFSGQNMKRFFFLLYQGIIFAATSGYDATTRRRVRTMYMRTYTNIHTYVLLLAALAVDSDLPTRTVCTAVLLYDVRYDKIYQVRYCCSSRLCMLVCM